MAHAEFVPDVRVVERQVGHHQIGDEQLLEHVETDVTSALLLVGTEHIETSVDERGLQQIVEEAVEVDRQTVGAGLGAEGHGDEGLRGHGLARGWPEIGVRAIPRGERSARARREQIREQLMALGRIDDRTVQPHEAPGWRVRHCVDGGGAIGLPVGQHDHAH